MTAPSKAREIGLRFVETCATCLHCTLVREEAGSIVYFPRCQQHEGAVVVSRFTVCNDYECDDFRMTSHRTRLDPSLPVEPTLERHWEVCPHCGWEGWGGERIMHWMSAGGEEIISFLCPKCKGEMA